ncbi:putative sodium-dependent multivitamin transporter isoform X3 [Dermacentor albipictus]|uniref:putative sodium-dependent multivitamin transporter isoform X3 n=1 Tax=Dermacentor albipictus TaxID=60249 RepID=UPI0038FC8512
MEGEEQRATFGAPDYAVFSVMLVVSSLIGIYYRFTGDRQRTAREYLVANKNMSVVPVAFSLMASFMSAVTLLGVPSENYYYGTQFVIINIAYIFGTPIAAYVFLPVFYKLQVISVYEYLERRFGKATRLAMSATFVIQMVLYMAVVLYAPAVALSAVTGISKWLSIISVGLVCTFYCTIGGMKAVLWTDLFQSILMFVSMFAVVGVGTYRMGGVSNVWNEALAGGRIEFFKALFLNWPIVSALSLITSSAGIVMYANFRHCDPLLSGKITKTDQVLPYFVMLYLGGVPGLPGLFVAGIFSGALSTVSSAVNSLAAVMLEDFVRPFCISQKTYDKHASLILKVLAFFFGVLCVLLTGLVEQLGGVLQASFMIFGVVGGPLLGVFTLGFLCRRANQEAALSGLVAGLLMGFWIGIGATVYGVKPENLPLLDDKCPTSLGATSALTTAVSYVSENATTAAVIILAENTVSDNGTSVSVIAGERYILPLYRLSYQWYCGFGWLVVIVVGSIVTLLTGGAKDVDPYCLSPLVTKSLSRRQRSWSLDRVRNSSVSSSQIPMTAIKE